MTNESSAAAQSLLRTFFEAYPDEAARRLEAETPAEAVRLLGAVPAPRRATLLEHMTPDAAAHVLEEIPPQIASSLFTAMDPARSAALLARLDEEARNTRLEALDPALAEELRSLMSYPPDTAGSLMDPRALTFHPDATVEQALRKLRGFRRRRIHDIFVVAPGGALLGSISLQDLALSPPDEALTALLQGEPTGILSTASREEISDMIERQKITTLAVTDIHGRLLGVIRHEKLLAAAQEEASIDIQTMVGVSREERALSPIAFAVRKRLPWLNINLATAFLAASVVGIFSNIIDRFTALAVLLPVVAGQSGNTGAQALAVTMRGLALREIRVRQWLRVMSKEAAVGLFNGLAIALVTSTIVFFWSGSAGMALVIGMSMTLSMVTAGFAGAVIPMALTSAGQDPAQSSSILLTTVTDIVGFFSFLGIATMLSGLL